jgi:hypothetical protein
MFASCKSCELTCVTERGVSWTDISVPKTESTGVSVGSTDPSVEPVTTMVDMVPAAGAVVFVVVGNAEALEPVVVGGGVGVAVVLVVACAKSGIEHI